jgi:transcriptional regulator with XRE-family HTH domain
MAARDRDLRRRKIYGRFDTGLVDATPAREHLLMLADYGLGCKQVAKVAGIPVRAVVTLVHGRSHYIQGGGKGPRHGEVKKRVKRETADAILAVQPELRLLGDRRPYPARGTIRRIQALMCAGWSMTEIAARLDMFPSSVARLLRQRDTWASVARKVEALYEVMWDEVPVPETKYQQMSVDGAKRYAAAHGFVPALAWDDIDADPFPPEQEPAPEVVGVRSVEVELAMSGVEVELTAAEREEAVRGLHARYWSDSRIAAALRVDVRTVVRIRGRLGLPGLTQDQWKSAA